jgi:putative ABC transport system ATP-binding protein
LSLGRGAARVHILKDVDLNIGRGEAVALLGPSGSGKSTLLMVMTGLERPDSGSVVVAGKTLHKLMKTNSRASAAKYRHRVPGLPSDPDHDRAGKRRGAARIRRRARRACARRARIGGGRIERRLHHYPAELSGGEQQRVALARALAPVPRSSSPTSRPAISTRRPGREIIELLFRGHRERGTTLVLVTHDTALAARCDRVLHMHSGRSTNRKWPGKRHDRAAKRCVSLGASCAADCAASASLSPASRSASWRLPGSARWRKACPTASLAPAA